MRRLKLNFNGEARLFQADGTVAVIVRGAPVVRGTWRTKSTGTELLENLIRYRIDNVDQPPVPVRHSFNEYNQLVSIIPAAANGGTESEPCVWPGRIEVDDGNDLNYTLFDDDGTPLTSRLTVVAQGVFRTEMPAGSLLSGGPVAQALAADLQWLSRLLEGTRPFEAAAHCLCQVGP